MTGDGRVRAMIGGRDWSHRQFNTVVKANVQPGSTAKLPLLVAACEAGRKPESRVLDLPITPDWPSNGQLGYKGETTLKEAFVSSRNAAAVRLTQELGVRRVAEVSRRLGVDPGSQHDGCLRHCGQRGLSRLSERRARCCRRTWAGAGQLHRSQSDARHPGAMHSANPDGAARGCSKWNRTACQTSALAGVWKDGHHDRQR